MKLAETINVIKKEIRQMATPMNPRQVFAKEDIFEYAWDEPYTGETKTLDVHISNIRKKIKRLTDDEYIETVWGIGYKMKE